MRKFGLAMLTAAILGVGALGTAQAAPPIGVTPVQWHHGGCGPRGGYGYSGYRGGYPGYGYSNYGYSAYRPYSYGGYGAGYGGYGAGYGGYGGYGPSVYGGFGAPGVSAFIGF